MSYCRWSSDDYTCDVYVWADCEGGWRTEVAGRRHAWKVPLPPPVALPVGAANSPERTAWASAHIERMQAVSRLMDDETAFDLIELAEPEGGRSYWHDTPGECADNLERLRGLGFNVPQGAIDTLRGEQETDPAPTAAGEGERGEG